MDNISVINTYLYDNTLTVVFNQDLDPGVTGISNITANVYNASQYVYGSSDNVPCKIISDLTPAGTALDIPIPLDADALIIVEIVFGETKTKTVFLNKYMIYKAFDKHLQSECNTKCNACAQTSWKTATLAAMMRINLLNYAYENALLEDALKYYVDLSRSLDFNNITFESAPDK